MTLRTQSVCVVIVWRRISISGYMRHILIVLSPKHETKRLLGSSINDCIQSEWALRSLMSCDHCLVVKLIEHIEREPSPLAVAKRLSERRRGERCNRNEGC